MPDINNIRYVTLQVLFPRTSRVTLYRWRRAGLIPPPDLVIGNRSYYIERPLAPPQDGRRAKPSDDHSAE